MRKFILIVFTLFISASYTEFLGCNKASTTINSITDNGNGTYTINIDFCPEFNGLEGAPDWFGFTFSGGTFTSIASATPTTVTTTGGDDFNMSLLSGNTEIRWTGPWLALQSGNNLCFNTEIIMNGNPGQVDVHYHDTYGPSCEETILLPPPCSISAISGIPGACNPANNTYSASVTVTYAMPPSSGNLVVNGQSFPITSSPQTVSLTGLTADGNSVNVTAAFSADAGCTFTQNNAFTAPADCTPSCEITAITGLAGACNPANNTYSASVTVTYANDPGSGNLVVNGQSFPITSSPQTVSLNGLTADGNSVNVTAAFSADAGCTFTQNNAFTAPASCTPVCNISAISANPSACNPADNTYSVDITVTYSNDPGSGNLVINGQSFAITSSPQTETISGLTADGNSVNVTAAFSADAACTLTQNNAYTAPANCTPGCNANAGTISE